MTDWREGQILFDDLRLEKAIGAGAFGEVWRARQLSWERDVAVKRVKVSDQARIRLMEQEALHWLEIGLHPYVTTCYYTRRHEGAPVIVLEYASEGALDGWIKDGRMLFEERASELVMKLGLEAAWGRPARTVRDCCTSTSNLRIYSLKTGWRKSRISVSRAGSARS